MTLDARIIRTLGLFRLDVDLAIKSGETVAILGPNGSGKTTLFRCLAGLLPIDDGVIELDGELLDEPTTDTFVVPEQRPVAVVFQDYLLFPNLSALENVAFGLRARKSPSSRPAAAPVPGWSGSVSPTMHITAREPCQGARRSASPWPAPWRPSHACYCSMSPSPPSMPAHAATFAATYAATLPRSTASACSSPTIQSTPTPSLTASIILEHGTVVQAGSLADIAAQPRSPYIADLVGVNLLRGTGADGAIITATGGHIIPAEPVQGDAFVLIQPHSVALYTTVPEGSPRNVWAATVADVDRQADRVRVRLTGEIPLVAEITAAALDELVLKPGDQVWATVKATEITSYAA